MIPKIIHYCWFGGNPMPEEALRCIDSWKKYLPDYEIREWNESNFDIMSIPYTYEAYRMKLWAFVSDYVRFWALYQYGGIYLDTDIELIKDLNPIIQQGPYMGCEKDKPAKGIRINPGLGMAFDAGNPFLKEVLNYYANNDLKYRGYVLVNVVDIVSRVFKERGAKHIESVQQIDGISIYPPDYFCPMNYRTGALEITPDTHSIHHYHASWLRHKPFWQRVDVFIASKLKLPFSPMVRIVMKIRISYLHLCWWLRVKNKKKL